VLGDGVTTGTYKAAGSAAVDISGGDMTFSGNVTPDSTTDYTNL